MSEKWEGPSRWAIEKFFTIDQDLEFDLSGFFKAKEDILQESSITIQKDISDKNYNRNNRLSVCPLKFAEVLDEEEQKTELEEEPIANNENDRESNCNHRESQAGDELGWLATWFNSVELGWPTRKHLEAQLG